MSTQERIHIQLNLLILIAWQLVYLEKKNTLYFLYFFYTPINIIDPHNLQVYNIMGMFPCYDFTQSHGVRCQEEFGYARRQRHSGHSNSFYIDIK